MNQFRSYVLLALWPVLAQAQTPPAALLARADSLAHAAVLVDGHVDLPYRLKVAGFRFTKEYMGIPVDAGGEGDFDYVRARAGGLDAPFMSIYIPSAEQGPNRYGGRALADSLIDLVEAVAAANPEFAIATHPDSVRAQFARGVMSLPLGMENGAPLAYPEDVGHFAGRGIRYVTLTHAADNHICDSSYDTTGTWGGLSPYGAVLLDALTDHGIMIDISHVSDSAAYQVLRRVDVPVIASHSSLRHFTPDFERNMPDSMLGVLARNGGVIMINFGSTFLDGEVAAERERIRAAWGATLLARGLDFDDEAAEPVLDSLAEVTEMPFADVELVADHIDRAVQLAGVENVGFGSDYDGVGDSLPTGLKDVSDYPNLIAVLLARGYTATDIEGFMGANLLRVWDEVAARAGR